MFMGRVVSGYWDAGLQRLLEGSGAGYGAVAASVCRDFRQACVVFSGAEAAFVSR